MLAVVLAVLVVLTIIGITHDRKMRADDFINSVIGSVGSVGSSGVIWSLKRKRGKADAALYATGWDVRDLDLPLLFDAATGWQLLDGTATEHKQSEERQAILDVLEEAGEPMAPKDIAAALGKKPEAVRYLLMMMKKDGTVESPKKGIYSHNTNALTN